MIIRLAFVAALLSMIVGCAQNHAWYDNARVLEATPTHPASGGKEQRAFVSSELKDAELGPLFVDEVTIKGTKPGTYPEEFLPRLALATRAGAAAAAMESKRFSALVDSKEDAEYLLATEALVHVAVLEDGRVVEDPVMGDIRSKAVVVYTITNRATGRVAVKYSNIVYSDWGYTKRVYEDLERKLNSAGADLLFIFVEM
ncbi:MAG: hypothetical protein C0609_00315 [Deltaproteobacteria bacterium]|nr:MAG: hypothetical protein C0609_00315 [Deltaproteobacteria bacterium]